MRDIRERKNAETQRQALERHYDVLEEADREVSVGAADSSVAGAFGEAMSLPDRGRSLD